MREQPAAACVNAKCAGQTKQPHALALHIDFDICHHSPRALYWREMLGAIRNPTDVAGRMLLFTFIGVTCGLVFWRMGDGRGLESLHNRINLMFVMALQLMLLP